jgi:hypothetical protein
MVCMQQLQQQQVRHCYFTVLVLLTPCMHACMHTNAVPVRYVYSLCETCSVHTTSVFTWNTILVCSCAVSAVAATPDAAATC